MPPPSILLPNTVQLIAEKLLKSIGTSNTKTSNNNNNETSGHSLVNIPSHVLDKTTEQLRILDTRAKIGALGKAMKKCDGPESRAAVLLAETLRKETNTVVSWKDLEKAVGIRATHLEQLHQILLNYLYSNTSTTTVERSVRVVSRKRTAFSAALMSLQQSKLTKLDPSMKEKCKSDEENGTTLTSLSRTMSQDSNSTAPRSILADLAIRLPECPHGAAEKARRLIERMKEHIGTTASVHERRGLMYDFYRYYAAYEAAAMHVVTKVSCDELVAAASQHLTYLQLKQVLPHVEKIAKEMTITTATTKSTTASLPCKPNSARSRKKKLVEVDYLDTPGNQVMKPEIMEDTSTVRANNATNTTDAQQEEWQQQVLEHACWQARLAMQTAMQQKDITDTAARARAADDILRKHHILI